MLVKFIENKEIENGHYGLTIGNVYKIEGEYTFPCRKKAYTVEKDDDGDENELYDGEFEVVEE